MFFCRNPYQIVLVTKPDQSLFYQQKKQNNKCNVTAYFVFSGDLQVNEAIGIRPYIWYPFLSQQTGGVHGFACTDVKIRFICVHKSNFIKSKNLHRKLLDAYIFMTVDKSTENCHILAIFRRKRWSITFFFLEKNNLNHLHIEQSHTNHLSLIVNFILKILLTP